MESPGAFDTSLTLTEATLAPRPKHQRRHHTVSTGRSRINCREACSRPATNSEQMSTRANQAGFRLHAPDGSEQLRALPRLFEPSIKIR